MLTILLFTVIGAVVGLVFIKESKGWAILINGMVGIIVGIIIGMLSLMLIEDFLPTEYVLVEETELVAFQDSSSIQGRFFLGTGSIRSDFFYLFCKRERSGAIRFGKLLVNARVSIMEENRENGILRKYELQISEDEVRPWGIVRYKKTKYAIHIPKGSMVNNFKLDLESH